MIFAISTCSRSTPGIPDRAWSSSALTRPTSSVPSRIGKCRIRCERMTSLARAAVEVDGIVKGSRVMYWETAGISMAFGIAPDMPRSPARECAPSARGRGVAQPLRVSPSPALARRMLAPRV